MPAAVLHVPADVDVTIEHQVARRSAAEIVSWGRQPAGMDFHYDFAGLLLAGHSRGLERPAVLCDKLGDLAVENGSGIERGERQACVAPFVRAMSPVLDFGGEPPGVRDVVRHDDALIIARVDDVDAGARRDAIVRGSDCDHSTGQVDDGESGVPRLLAQSGAPMVEEVSLLVGRQEA